LAHAPQQVNIIFLKCKKQNTKNIENILNPLNLATILDPNILRLTAMPDPSLLDLAPMSDPTNSQID
jgi:hypothetical protein